jgi:hypothetical protein
MGADTRTAGGLTGPALEVIRHPDDRFYELLADGQFAGLIVYEDAGGRYVFTHPSSPRATAAGAVPGSHARRPGGRQAAAHHRDELLPGAGPFH